MVDVANGHSARDLTHQLRQRGIVADRNFDNRSMRSQMRSADRSGAEIALIIGEQELADQTVAIRMLRGDKAPQTVVARDEILNQVQQLLGPES